MNGSRLWLVPLLPLLMNCGGSGDGALSVTPLTLEFGPVPVGQSKTAELTVTNGSKKDLALTTLNISGEAGDDFSHGLTLPVLLLGDSTVSIGLDFAPEDLGERTAFLSLGLEEGTATVIGLEGEGIEPPTPTAPPTPPPTPLPGDTDGDGYNDKSGDCDEGNPDINPGATELCNGIDDNCNGTTDDVPDLDNDDYLTCGDNQDCDDDDAAVHPGAQEICDGKDNNCDGTRDEGLDEDSDGITACSGDCDDTNPLVYPGANDGCNGRDNDCDGNIDEDAGDLDGNGVSDCEDTCPVYVKAGADAGVAVGSLAAPYADLATALLARGTCPTVAVLAGTYNEPVVFPTDERLDLVAPDGPSATILTGPSPIVTISNVTVEASLEGFTLKDGGGTKGACLLIKNSDVVIRANRFENCAATGAGGAVYVEGGTPTLDKNHFTGNKGSIGGAVYIAEAEAVVTGNTFESNEATEEDAGALALVYANNTVVEDNTFDANIAAGQGGAVKFIGSNGASFTGNQLSSNSSGAGGGGVAVEEGEGMSLSGNIYTDNVSGTNGGALYLNTADGLTASDETMTGNSASSSGGGIFVYKVSNSFILDSTLVLNRADTNGGGLWLQESTEVTVQGCTISSNDAAISGGGIGLNEGGNYYITACILKENRALGGAATGGGAVFFFTGARGTLQQTVMMMNQAYNGGAVYVTNSAPRLRNNLFLGNISEFQGGGVYAIYGSPEISNSTFVGNSGPSGGGAIIWGVGGAATKIDSNIIANSVDGNGVAGFGPYASISYNDVYGNADGSYQASQGIAGPGDLTGQSGNIEAEPQFVNFSDDGDWSNDDFHLASGSPCIDKGIPDTLYNDTDATRNDMGAYGGPLGAW